MIRTIFVVTVWLTAISPAVAAWETQEDATPSAKLSHQVKQARVAAWERAAVKCVADKVSTDPRVTQSSTDVGDLIVEMSKSCVEKLRAMADAYVRYMGNRDKRPIVDMYFADVILEVKVRLSKSQ